MLKFLFFFVAGNCVNLSAAYISRGPYLEDFSKNSAVIRFRTVPATFSWLTYGAYPDCERFTTFSGFNSEHNVRLNGLLSDTTHCYRIYLTVDGSTNSYKAKEGYFRTFRDETTAIANFLVFGSSHEDISQQKELVKAAEKLEDAEFIIHTGNLTRSGLDISSDEEFFSVYDPLLSKLPFYCALGPLDYGPNYNSKEGVGFLKENFVRYHSAARNGMSVHYYFFDQGNARFIFLDSNAYAGSLYSPSLKKDSKQYAWLEYVLKNTKQTWKFVILHHPLYSSFMQPIDEQRDTLAAMFETYGVDIVFQYGGAGYERFKPIRDGEEDESGVVYICLGWGKQEKVQDSSLSEIALVGNYFLRTRIEGNTLEIKVYDSLGEIKDSYYREKK